MTARRFSPGDLDCQAHDLYRRYGAHSWGDLPEAMPGRFRGAW
jgi:hypothetical protein